MSRFLNTLLLASMALCTLGAKATEADTLIAPIGDVATPLQLQLLSQQLQAPTGIALLPRTSFSYNSLSYQHEGGRMMRLQTPESANSVHLHAIGLHSTPKWQLYGEFRYARLYEDSVQWLLSELPESGMPYYFATPKKGNWEREQYDLRGTFHWNATRCFATGASVDIRHRRGARSNDPRPSTESFLSHYHLYAGLTFPYFSALVSAGLGFGTSDNDFIYSNPENDRILRLDAMAYEFMGFGMQRKTQAYQNRTLESNCYTKHLGLQVHGTLGKANLWAHFNYTIQHDSIRRSRVTNVSRSLLSTYKLHKYDITAGLNTAFSSHTRLQAQAYAQVEQGADLLVNILQGQKNYTYAHRRMGADAILYTTSPSHVQSQYGLSVAYDFEQKQDGSSQHHFKHSDVEVALMWHQYHPLTQGYHWFYSAMQGITLGTATLHYPPTQQNIFSTDIATPLYNYYNTPKGYTGLRLGAGRRLGRYALSLSFTYTLAYALSHDYSISGTRHNLNAAVIFSF